MVQSLERDGRFIIAEAFRGDPAAPLTDEQLTAKYRALVAPHISRGRADALYECIRHADTRPDWDTAWRQAAATD